MSANAIPWWVYVIFMVLGLGLTILFAVLWAGARRRARMYPGAPGGTGFLVGAILSFVLLLIAPLVAMLILQPWDSGRSSRGDRGDRGDFAGTPSSTSTTDGRWRVTFTVDNVTYSGEYRPSSGAGPMVLVVPSSGGGEARIRQTCVMNGQGDIRIDCRDAVVVGGSTAYRPDNFRVRLAADGSGMNGDFVTPDGVRTGTATFTRGPHERIAESDFTAIGSPAAALPTAPATQGSQANPNLAAALSQAADQMRARLPQRSGPSTITAVEVIGTTLNMYQTLDMDVSAAQWPQLEASIRQSTCAGSFGRLIPMGASVNYQLLDAGEEQRTITVSSC